jgi:co-chaperonin GroES (HSP10)
MNPLRVRPLTGQVLVELLPPPRQTDSGLFIPESKHPKQEQAIVKKIGPWRKNKSGMAVLPEFGIGARVIIAAESGTKARGEIGQMLKLVRVEHVRAVLTETVPKA